MGDLVQLRDYQSRAAIERAHKALEEHLNREAIAIANEAFPSVFGLASQESQADWRDGFCVRLYDPKTHWPSDYRPPEKDGA